MRKANSIARRVMQIGAVRRIVVPLRATVEYAHDAVHFCWYSMEGVNSTTGPDYRARWLTHALEKGLSRDSARLFGVQKAVELLALLEASKDDSSRSLAQSTLDEACAVLVAWHEEMRHRDRDGAAMLPEVREDLLAPRLSTVSGPTCAWSVRERIDTGSMLTQRRSIRRFLGVPVEQAIVDECIEEALSAPSACNRQMVKLYTVRSHGGKERLFESLHGTGGFEFDEVTLGIITFDTSAFSFGGERNQGYLNAGLFAMALCMAFEMHGLGSCLLQFGNWFREEASLKRQLGIPPAERIAVCVGFGYPQACQRVPASGRRSPREVSIEVC